tara:strand:- start:18569 stop:19306 length:738 start_codon:yes stop_codon:yes gene_type:complete
MKPSKSYVYALLALQAGLVLSIASANSQNTPTNVSALGIIYDASLDSYSDQTFDADAAFKGVVQRFGFSDIHQARYYYSTICGENTIASIQSFEIKKSNPISVSTRQRKDLVGRFLLDVKDDIKMLSEQPVDQGQTNLYRTLTRLVDQFEPDTTGKHILIISNLAEHSSALQMSSRYTKSPSKILDDYDVLVKSLSNDTPLPNLDGFSVELITPGKTDYHLWLSRFWKKFLLDRGAKQVLVRSSF